MSEYKPITGELRKVMNHTEMRNVPLVELGEYEFARRCDEIDAIHAGLERENAVLKAELDRVLGEQEEHAHTRGESITGELREVAAKTECANGRCEKLYRGDLEHIADRIDAEHEAQLNDAFETRNSDENLESDGWVRKEEGKTISAYYVDVVPRFDWKLMALELEQFAEIVRGMAGDDE